MRARSITPNLTQLTRVHFVNAFLVREDDGITLVDTTFPGAASGLIAAADKLGASIKRIAMTHGHGDHVGSAARLKEQLGSSVEVLIPELDAAILAGEEFADKKPPGGWPKFGLTPDVRLKVGDRVRSLEVIDSPGHTPGHVSFLDTRDRTVIAGDVYTTYGGVTVTSHFHLRFPLPAMATWDKAKDVESAQALRDLQPSLLVVGHGPAVRDPAAGMDRAIARARAALG